MKLEHVAIWVEDLEKMTTFYESFLGGKRNELYRNELNDFSSYFLTFSNGARLELMHRPNIPDNLNDVRVKQHKGIIHLAFQMDSRKEVDEKALDMNKKGFPILRGPRITGDGYYEFETLDPEGNRLEVTAL